MARKIIIEVDLGFKAVEKTDIAVYLDGQLIENYWNYSYSEIPNLAKELRVKYPDAEIERQDSGIDYAGRTHRWKVEV